MFRFILETGPPRQTHGGQSACLPSLLKDDAAGVAAPRPAFQAGP
jgi:hypothetical protein